ncbi:MAG: iron-containing alcohol dehydrogenase [Epulopiscium sp.]|nr:iron-containing alcohol dehydrogenase [Candidatus Epulonipiscium sp.]
MMNFQYYMPTQIYFGAFCIKENQHLLKNYGERVLIVTGRSSSKKNGSLDDILQSLQDQGIESLIFDEVEENPSLETLEKAAQMGKDFQAQFVIGVGGGSPVDAAKGIGVLVQNPTCTVHDLFQQGDLQSLPIVAVVTTSGTGTETTPYAIFTDHNLQTKVNFQPKIFPHVAFLDPRYFETMPDQVAIDTAVDALSHLVEGYLTVKANVLSDLWAEQGMALWKDCISALQSKKWTLEQREKMILASTIGGMVIAQTGTSLPHGMGYAFTYFKDITHGKANGLLMKEYIKMHPNKEKTRRILDILGMETEETLGNFLAEILGEPIILTKEEIQQYTEGMVSNAAKLKNHPGLVTAEDIEKIYGSSCKTIE